MPSYRPCAFAPLHGPIVSMHNGPSVATRSVSAYPDTVFLRLILAWLLMAIALPTATAGHACHADMAMPAHPHATAGHHHEMPDHGMPAHVCAGCVPIDGRDGPQLTAPSPGVAGRPMSRIATLDLGQAAPPALPPPRSLG